MMLLTKIIEKKLIENYKLNQPDGALDLKPVVKFFGGGACTWLISEYNPETELFFGLCDFGAGFPELGYVSKQELFNIKFPPFGLSVERDRYWKANKTLQEYTDMARSQGLVQS